MREVKYKVWDTYDKVFTDKLTALYKNGNIVIYNVDKGYYFQPPTGKYIPVFYTGLKDKNGKEIYDGDILEIKLNECIWRYEIKSVESFGNNLFAITRYRNFEIDDNECQVMGDFYINDNTWNHIPYKAEIIGNIYENSDLLK
jgi:uncharacterized phage protein (TIGR01671 family)